MRDWIVLIIVQLEILAFVLMCALGLSSLEARVSTLESELITVKQELVENTKTIDELQGEVIFLNGDNAVTRKIVDDAINGW